MDLSKNAETTCNQMGIPKKEPIVPAYMNVIMRRQFLQEMVKNLPPVIQNRITALKNMQLEFLKIEEKFFEEVYQLEKKYQQQFQPLYEKRMEIVVGNVDPPKTETKWRDLEIEGNNQEFYPIMKEFKEIPNDVKGIPNFWLTIFRNSEILSDMVQEYDEPLMKKLLDIKINYNDDHSYTLEFHFDKNDYFSNRILTKQYFLKTAVSDDDPFAYEGSEIYKSKGCIINWEKKMNLTVKNVRKKQKHKENFSVRTVIKQVPNDTFFNFFDPPNIPDDKMELDVETQTILATDFEIGHFLRARIIPKAILYFTGDLVDDEDEDDELDEEEEDEDEDEVLTNKSVPDSEKTIPKIASHDCTNQ